MRLLEGVSKLILGLVIIFIVPLAIVTNPNKLEYVAYVSSRFPLYAQAAICDRAPFSSECTTQLSELIQRQPNYLESYFYDHTTRSNLSIFSLYQTQLQIELQRAKFTSKRQLDFTTIGVFQTFITIQKPLWDDFEALNQ